MSIPFYNGINGQNFKISKVFSNYTELLNNTATNSYIGDYVSINYGIINSTEYFDNLTQDLQNYQTNYNNTIWQKTYSADTPTKFVYRQIFALEMPARGTQIFANVDKDEIIDAMIGDLYLSSHGLIEKYSNSQTWEPAFNLSTASYPNVEALKADTTLALNNIVSTVGYYQPGDGGAATYQIVAEQPAAAGFQELDNGLYAHLLVDKFVTPEMFGAIGDGQTFSEDNQQRTDNTTIDTIAITNALTRSLHLKLTHGKTYLIKQIQGIAGMFIDGDGATLKRVNLSQIWDPTANINEVRKWNRLIDLRVPNPNNLITRIENVVFDGNFLENDYDPETIPSNQHYKFEQAPCIGTAGQEGKLNLIINNCQFKNNYSSGISIAGSVNCIITNSECIDCFKGIVTFVGAGSQLMVDNVRNYNHYNYFHTINIEINSESGKTFAERAASNVYLNNLYVEGYIKLGGMTGNGKVEINNMIATKMRGFIVITLSNLNINNSYFELGDSTDSEYDQDDAESGSEESEDDSGTDTAVPTTGEFYLRCSKQSANDIQNIVFNNVTFKGVSGVVKDRLSYRTAGYPWLGKISFQNCFFENLAECFAIRTGSGGAENQGTIEFLNCVFNNIKSYNNVNGTAVRGIVIGPEETWFKMRNIIFDNCIFNNVDRYIYYNTSHNYATTFDPNIYFKGSNRILTPCLGLKLAGHETLYFNNEKWDNGLGLVESSFNLQGISIIGNRYRVLSIPEESTEEQVLQDLQSVKGLPNHDIAIINSHEYIYNGTAWVRETQYNDSVSYVLDTSDNLYVKYC